MKILTEIESKINNSKIPTIPVLIAIFVIGISFRVFFTPWTIPSNAPDALVYLIEAQRLSEGDFSNLGNRFVWPLFLSFFFFLFKYSTYFEYATLMKVISILVSSATIFVVYVLAKKLAGRKIALISAFLFAIEPNIIENATLAIREPVFLLIGLSAIYFVTSKNEKLIPLAFVLAGISWDARINGIAIFLIVLITTFLVVKDRKSLTKTLIVGIPLFLIISFPFTIIPLEKGQFPLLEHLVGVNQMVSSEVATTATFVEGGNDSSLNIVGNALWREFLHLIRINYPILIPFAPVGLFLLFRNFIVENKIILISLVVSYSIAFPIYFLSAEFRNLLFLTPFLCMISSNTLEKFSSKFKFKSLILLAIFIALVVTSLFFLYDRLYVDEQLVIEERKFAVYVADNFSGNLMGDMYGIVSFYLPQAKIGNSSLNQPNIFNDKTGLVVAPLPLDDKEKLQNIIKERDVKYLIIDDKYDRRYAIFEEILVNESNFPFLEKIFDSKQSDYQKLHVKIFKINLTK